MNRSYKSIFNRRLGVWQVTSELVHGAGKTGNTVKKSALALTLSLATGGVMAQVLINNGDTVRVPSGPQPTPWNVGTTLVIGETSNGTLIIENGGVVSDTVGYVGENSGVTGAVTVTGENSAWDNSQMLVVGIAGTGTLIVEDGGKVTSAEGYVGTNPGGTGIVTVTGENSSWINNGTFGVGGYNRGTLNIEDGGVVVTSGYSYIGGNAAGNGTVTVTGQGSKWSATQIDLSYAGTGRLVIENGGTVSSPQILLASQVTGNATLDLNGTSTARGTLATAYLRKGAGTATFNWNGGILQATGNEGNFLRNLTSTEVIIGSNGAYFDTNSYSVGLNVASLGGSGNFSKLGAGTLTLNGNSSGVLSQLGVEEGTLTIAGNINSARGLIDYTGNDINKTATVTINGATRSWIMSNTLLVGNDGRGTLNISNGAQVSAAGGSIAYSANSEGAITVKDANTSLAYTATVYVGDGGKGSLTVETGAQLSTTNMLIGRAQNSEGTTTVTGANSSLGSSSITIGSGGTGTFNIENGATVTNGNAAIGFGLNSTGTATVTGANSSWTNSTGILIGVAGSGTLNIENGGAVTSNTAAVMGTNLNSVGTATVTGPNSRWTNSNDITIGEAGNATLNILNGGAVSSQSIILGNSAPSTATLNLGGTGTTHSILSTGYVRKGSGTVIFNWDGGILQASGNQANFLQGFAANGISIASNGAYFDTQAYNVGVQSAGVFTGSGGLTKLGSGTLSIAGGNTYTGNTTVANGILQFDSYTQSASQTLGIGAASDTVYGKLQVANVANFQPNANIYVDVASPATPALAVGNTLTGVITAGTLNASGFKVTDNSALFNFRAIQQSNSVDLRVVSNSASGIRDAVIEQGHWSALGAADVLDTQLNNGANGDMGKVINAMGLLPSNREVARAASQTLPVISGNQAIQGALSTFQQLIQGRNTGSNATGLPSGDSITNKQAWGKVFGSRAEQDDRSGAAGFKADSWGLAFGADRQVAPDAHAGLAYAYAKTSVNGNTDLAGTAQRANIATHIISAYGSKDLGQQRTFSAQADIGVSNSKTTRHIEFGGLNRNATADYRTYSAHIGATIAQAFDLSDKTTLTPAIRADYSWLKSQAYNEAGADSLNLNVASQKTDAFIIGADAHLQHRYSASSRLDANFGVGYDTINKRGNILAAYAGAPGQTFITTGIDHSPWISRGGIGWTYTTSSGTEVAIRYDAEGRSDYLNQTASVRAKWMF